MAASRSTTTSATRDRDGQTAKKLGLKVKRGVGTAGSGSGKAGPSGGRLVVKLTRIKKAKTVKAVLVLTTSAPGQAPVVTRKAVTIG